MNTGDRVSVNGQLGTVTNTMIVAKGKKFQTLVNVQFDSGARGTFDKASIQRVTA